MNSNSKDKVLVSLMAAIFLVTVFGIGYLLLGKSKVAGLYTTPTVVVESSNSSQIEQYKKHSTVYAVKDDGYLKYYWSDGGNPTETILVLEAVEYNKLVPGKTYWFDIDLTISGDLTSGAIKSVYTEDINRK
jgi:hypothetical protein